MRVLRDKNTLELQYVILIIFTLNMLILWCHLEALLAFRAPCITGEVSGLGVDMSCALKSLQGMLYKEPFLSAVF